MRKLRFSLTIFLFAGCLASINSQEAITPHFMTQDEAKIMVDYLKEKHESAVRSVPIPPPGKVRTMAEWEEIQALIITWAGQTTILREIVRHSVKECKVLIITTDSVNVTNQIVNAGIPMDSVEFVNTPYNTIWVRDYGPWTVYKNDIDSLWIVDWIYNRPRANDDASPIGVAKHLNLPIYEATAAPFNWVHTGGNHLPDGMGTAFSSNLVLEENPDKTEAQIDSIANLFLGVTQYIKFPTLPYDGIHHLDMHMRVIDEETIFFGEYPEGTADGPQIESNINYLQEEYKTAFGNKYNILRLPMPPDQNGRYPNTGGNYRTYTNSIFVNKTILVPTYEEKYDTTALRIYRENLPGYNVVGINCNSIIPSLGALHCITKLVGTDEPLLIAHPRLRDSDDELLEYPVVAYIKHRSGIAEANLYYKTFSDSNYITIPMVLADTATHAWASLIPPHAAGTEIHYYIQAVANNGKQQVRPLVAPEGYFRFNIHGELPNQPPTVKILSPLNESIFSANDDIIQFEFEAADTDGTIDHAIIFINGESIATIDGLPYIYDWITPAEGSYSVVVKATDDDGSITFSDTIRIAVEQTTSTVSAYKLDKIFIYPNPVQHRLNIRMQDISIVDVDVKVFNTLGQLVVLPMLDDLQEKEIDFSSAPSGMYFIRFHIGDNVIGYRIIKN